MKPSAKELTNFRENYILDPDQNEKFYEKYEKLYKKGFPISKQVDNVNAVVALDRMMLDRPLGIRYEDIYGTPKTDRFGRLEDDSVYRQGGAYVMLLRDNPDGIYRYSPPIRNFLEKMIHLTEDLPKEYREGYNYYDALDAFKEYMPLKKKSIIPTHEITALQARVRARQAKKKVASKRDEHTVKKLDKHATAIQRRVRGKQARYDKFSSLFTEGEEPRFLNEVPVYPTLADLKKIVFAYFDNFHEEELNALTMNKILKDLHLPKSFKKEIEKLFVEYSAPAPVSAPTHASPPNPTPHIVHPPPRASRARASHASSPVEILQQHVFNFFEYKNNELLEPLRTLRRQQFTVKETKFFMNRLKRTPIKEVMAYILTHQYLTTQDKKNVRQIVKDVKASY